MSHRSLLNLATVGFGIFMILVLLFFDVLLASLTLRADGNASGQVPPAFVTMLVMLHLGLLFWFWLIWWRVPRQRSFDPAWRGVIRRTRRGLRVRLQPMNRMLGVWGVLQIATYFGHLAAMVIVMSNAESAEWPAFQSLALPLASLFWFLGGCIAAVVWWREPLVGVVQDDVNAGTLSWRNLAGKKKYEGAVVRQWVTRVEVEEGLSRWADLTPSRVVLHWVNDVGEPLTDTFAEYLNPADAEALAGWLRERLGLGEPPCSPEGATGNSQG